MAMTRDELIFLLNEAAELEHFLTCAYLFAGFSLKQPDDPDLSEDDITLIRSWGMSIILVAREEMEHLSMVNNMLTAIGGAPHFRRPNFPKFSPAFDQPFSLDAFGPETIKRFIRFEAPEGPLPQIDPTRFQGVAPERLAYHSVSELYMLIQHGMEQFPEGEAALFIGPPEAQIDGTQMGLDFPRLGQMGGVFDFTLFPVTDLASAKRAIAMILEQGEGGPSGDEGSHYWRFLQIQKEMEARPDLMAARPVVPNPRLQNVDRVEGVTIVTHPDARAVMDLFNAAYETMLLILVRFYAHTDETDAQLATLRYAAFFPMMTMVIRPLSEIITDMPAFEAGGPERAGPSFEMYSTVSFLPHADAAWTVLTERMDELAAAAEALAKRDIHPRMPFVAESIVLLAAKFKHDLLEGTA